MQDRNLHSQVWCIEKICLFLVEDSDNVQASLRHGAADTATRAPGDKEQEGARISTHDTFLRDQSFEDLKYTEMLGDA